jgi:two-component system, cell cycle response regulator
MREGLPSTLNRARIVLADDDARSREALAEMLRDAGYEVLTAGDGASALELFQSSAPDLVITDLTMPHLGGFGLAQCIRQANHPAADVPIILISGHGDSPSRVHGFEFGADDFLVKPLDVDELLARIERHLSRYRSQREAAQLSVSDELTGTLNRRGLRNFFARMRGESLARGQPVSVLLVDVTKFKSINDRYGHAVGDLALCAVARVRQDSVRTSDRVGRVGGDEFLVVLPGADEEACAQLESRLVTNLPLNLALTDLDQILITFAIGSATAHEAETLEALTARADRAMYADKQALGLTQSTPQA